MSIIEVFCDKRVSVKTTDSAEPNYENDISRLPGGERHIRKGMTIPADISRLPGGEQFLERGNFHDINDLKSQALSKDLF
ncbi:hypothetical protein [Pseudovibrio exalbescens]|uniref:hypothetical protein n=1 Tax=Pseudovibrio exalbescens TaxID=197461 RepID=UPI0011AFA9D8|nr:hypothetical protein [Pseudovibrio exalbescens]